MPFFDAVNRRNIRMVDRREEFRLAFEPSQPLAVVAEPVGQDLDRHIARQAGVVRAVHLAHSAGADGVADLVAADARARLERHCASGLPDDQFDFEKARPELAGHEQAVRGSVIRDAVEHGVRHDISARASGRADRCRR